MSKLTPKQEMFCREYLVDLNGTQAAIRAGYSANSAQEQASQLLSKLIIQDFVRELKSQREERVKIDADWVLKQAVSVHLRCMQAEKVTDRKGEPVVDPDGRPVYKFDSSGANKALELVGKHINIQAFKENTSIEIGGAITPWGSIEAKVDE